MSNGRPPSIDNSQACQRIRDSLRYGPLTPQQIADRAFVGIATLTKGGYLRAMEAAGLIHVEAWKPPTRSGMWTPMWALGPGPSVPRPPRQTNTEYARRWRHKVGNARAAQRSDIARMENTPPPAFTPPAEIRNWLTGVPA